MAEQAEAMEKPKESNAVIIWRGVFTILLGGILTAVVLGMSGLRDSVRDVVNAQAASAARVEKIEGKLDGLKADIEGVRTTAQRTENVVEQGFRQMITDLTRRVSTLESQSTEQRRELTDLRERLAALCAASPAARCGRGGGP